MGEYRGTMPSTPACDLGLQAAITNDRVISTGMSTEHTRIPAPFTPVQTHSYNGAISNSQLINTGMDVVEPQARMTYAQDPMTQSLSMRHPGPREQWTPMSTPRPQNMPVQTNFSFPRNHDAPIYRQHLPAGSQPTTSPAFQMQGIAGHSPPLPPYPSNFDSSRPSLQRDERFGYRRLAPRPANGPQITPSTNISGSQAAFLGRPSSQQPQSQQQSLSGHPPMTHMNQAAPHGTLSQDLSQDPIMMLLGPALRGESRD
ncbi:hypothetical protein F4778DRAFT_727668 [Xylariomycetidae sp. FL2044]|nr:hypothetical protein F4778DRAFT_727668 [Xylariomycetidae sp. FL2044]